MNEQKFIVFDTEIFGLIDSISQSMEDLTKWPEIKQICWKIFSKDGKEIKSRNEYFISGENSSKREVIAEFSEDFNNSDLAIAHNFQFDSKIFEAECHRYQVDCDFLSKVKYYDSMLSNIELCNLENKNGYLKYPTLMELYYHLFSENFLGWHDAENDVIATAKCFWSLRQRGLIDFNTLYSLKEAIKLQEEKDFEDLMIFYNSRTQFGEYILKSCNVGVIGEIERLLKLDIEQNKNCNYHSPNIKKNSVIMLQWINELELVFINSNDKSDVFLEYVEFKSLDETMNFLQARNLYFPEDSFQLMKSIVQLHLKGFHKPIFKEIAQVKLYTLIAELIANYQRLEPKHKATDLTKKHGCSALVLMLIAGMGILINAICSV